MKKERMLTVRYAHSVPSAERVVYMYVIQYILRRKKKEETAEGKVMRWGNQRFPQTPTLESPSLSIVNEKKGGAILT